MTANRIIHDIWVGDLEDAKVWDGNLLCVLETRPDSEPENALHIPILFLRWEKIAVKDEHGNDSYNYTTNGFVDRALPVQLDAVAHVIQNHVDAGTKLLVHCSAGMERSPLALTWYMHTRAGLSLEEAFEFVKSKRPQAENRLEWIVGYTNSILK